MCSLYTYLASVSTAASTPTWKYFSLASKSKAKQRRVGIRL